MKNPNRFGGLLAWAGVVALGCGKPPSATPVSSPAPAAEALAGVVPALGAACALSSGKPSQAAPRVFIELAALQGEVALLPNRTPTPGAGAGAASTGIEQIVSDSRIERASVHHVLLPNDASQTLPWEVEQRDGSLARWDITVTPHIGAPPSAAVRMELALVSSRSPSAAAAGAGPGGAQTTVVVRDQQSVVLGSFDLSQREGREAVLIVTPYVLWEDADLWRLSECKRKQAQEERAKRGQNTP